MLINPPEAQTIDLDKSALDPCYFLRKPKTSQHHFFGWVALTFKWGMRMLSPVMAKFLVEFKQIRQLDNI